MVTEIARRFWGGEEAADFTTLKPAPEAARRIQDRQLAKECLCVCDWMYPVLDIPVEDGDTSVMTGVVGNPALEAAVLRAAIGGDWDEDSLNRVGERVFQLQRAILLREGHTPLEDDVLPTEWHEVPLDGHVADPDCLVPGPDGRIVSRLGARIGMEDYLPARDAFYRLRGWDCRTGLPAVSHLNDLELHDVAEDLADAGLAVAAARGPSPGTRISRLAAGTVTRLRSRRERTAASGTAAFGPPLDDGEIDAILRREAVKYADQRIVHNFAGWNKSMQYTFPDVGRWYLIPFSEGLPGEPERLEEPLPSPDIEYEMDSCILRAMDTGRINGMQAYQKRLLKTRASFGDLMKPQSLNQVS